MAQSRENRMHSRTNCRIQLECLVKQSEKPFQATVFNVGNDGVYLETDRELKPGEDILIHTSRKAPEETAFQELGDNAGIIRWSRYMGQGAHHIFGAGVKFYSPKMMEDFKGPDSLICYCDMCSKGLSLTDARKSTGIVGMCPGCNTYVENLPEALQKTASRFLIGNVL